MTTDMRTVALSVLFATAVATTGVAQVPSDSAARCFRLTAGDWSPYAFRIRLDSVIIRLDTLTLPAQDRVLSGARQLLPASADLGIPPFVRPVPAYWYGRDDALVLEWRTAIQGIRVSAVVRNDTLRGRAHFWSDGVDVVHAPRGLTASVVAPRVQCAR